MNDVTTFNFRSHNVRTILIDNEPWFVAKDVAEALGYTNPSKATSDHCRGITKRYPILDALGRTQEVRIIREPDLYRLIVGSTLPAAQEFEVWVFEEVLPSIRKTGKYEMQKVSSMPAQPPIREEVEARRFKAAQDILKTGYEMAQMFGLTGNQALLKADKVTRQLSNISPMALLEIELRSPVLLSQQWTSWRDLSTGLVNLSGGLPRRAKSMVFIWTLVKFTLTALPFSRLNGENLSFLSFSNICVYKANHKS